MGIYEELGVRTLINAGGTLTRIGGSLMSAEVIAAMNQAAQSFVQMDELLQKAGQRIAALAVVEAAFVTAGAAAGLAISTAACMAGGDPVKVAQLPDSSGMPNEVVILRCHRSRYDQAILLAGARFVEVGLCDRTYPEELDAAIGPRTAMVFYNAKDERVNGSLPLATVVAIAERHGAPVVVDAAAELPPVQNLHRFADMGVALTVYSGGKDLGGPQASGLILGRRDLISACAANACPHHSVGRPMKADKEAIAGLVKAVELYVRQDFAAEMEQWESMVQHIVDELSGIAGLKVWRGFPTNPGVQPVNIPRAYLEFDEARLGMTAADLPAKLMEGAVAIFASVSDGRLVINPHTLQPGEERIIAQRLREIISS